MKQYGIDIPQKGKFIIVLCSKWCKSCKLLSTILENFQNEEDFSLKEIDIADNSKIAQEFGIFAVPALIFFKNGKLLNKNIEIGGETLVNKGIMNKSFNELILKEVINRI